ncbi:polysaccharide biosynthesis protein, partial [Planctomycetota bacterium]
VLLRQSCWCFLFVGRERWKNGRRTLIVGAGDSAEHLARELLRTDKADNLPVAFVDDDPMKQQMRFHRVPVMGTTDDIERIVKEQAIEEIILAMPSVPGEKRREIVAKCETAHLPIKTLPSIEEILSGKASYADVRTVRPEDLLTREEIRLDTTSVSEYLEGKRILITGAAGSIGSELCRQVSEFKPSELILLDHNENKLYFLERELVEQGVHLRSLIGSIRDSVKMRKVFEEHRPHVVFHAAAHKHVPLVERDPEEAVKNNILGTRILAELCEPFGVERFVLISTDKAINPTSVMGCSKRIAEMIVQHLGKQSQTRFCSVRFGNVLGSYGSVVPLFQRQIEKGGPVTVTHPEVRRYFMTIPEAVQLVLQTAAIGESGKVYMLNMGEQVKIDLLARDLITLHGLEPDKDIRIEYIGMRDGEKLHEELVGENEKLIHTTFDHINVVEPENSPVDIVGSISELETLVSDSCSAADVVAVMKRMVPTFAHFGSAIREGE